jgi:cytochrome c5
MTRGRLAALAAAPLIASALASAQAPSAPATASPEGIYSAEQSRRGRTVYDAKCASCHDGGTMGPELWGDAFLTQWERKRLSEFYTRIQTTMPEDAPGSMSEAEILDAIAYVLEMNGFKPGDHAIPRASALAALVFGPKK